MSALLIDQQLPQALATHLAAHGHDAVHVKEYPGVVTLPDSEIAAIADAEGRAVITKDEDFRISHLLNGRPDRLVHVTCGNISTRELLALVDHFHAELAGAIARYRYVELDRSGVIVHDPS